jgi:hypothetical protein
MPGFILLLWLLGLVGNAVGPSRLWSGSGHLPPRRPEGRPGAPGVGMFLVAMFLVSGLIFLVLFNRWVTT